jgi:hypothetical protein
LQPLNETSLKKKSNPRSEIDASTSGERIARRRNKPDTVAKQMQDSGKLKNNLEEVVDSVISPTIISLQ